MQVYFFKSEFFSCWALYCTINGATFNSLLLISVCPKKKGLRKKDNTKSFKFMSWFYTFQRLQ